MCFDIKNLGFSSILLSFAKFWIIVSRFGAFSSQAAFTWPSVINAVAGVVTPRIVMPRQAVTANRGIDGSGLRKSFIKAFMDSCLRRNDMCGRNDNCGLRIDKAITEGKSMANRVIQGLT